MKNPNYFKDSIHYEFLYRSNRIFLSLNKIELSINDNKREHKFIIKQKDLNDISNIKRDDSFSIYESSSEISDLDIQEPKIKRKNNDMWIPHYLRNRKCKRKILSEKRKCRRHRDFDDSNSQE